ncbi:MAG: 4Fe-4S binding protein [Desulfuromonadaceae bacterium]|nr:4Fe-4S binding protein [Desulfuromonadaceae bacterium]MDD2854485.1 4Fe-4S binding protein [Desulfuromonadaceae bacterium]
MNSTPTIDKATIDKDLCSGCGRCVAACPEKIITLEVIGFRKTATISGTELCRGCYLCMNICPISAIHR